MSFFNDYFNMMMIATKTFLGNPFLGICFIVSVIIIICLDRNKKNKTITVWFSLLVIMALYNPITFYLCRKVFGSSVAYYCRIFSLLPMGFVIAYAMTILLNNLKKYLKLVIIIVATLIIVFCGNNVYEESWIQEASNPSKLSNDVIQICDILSLKEGKKSVALPNTLVPYIRQYDASIIIPYGRWGDSNLKKELSQEYINIDTCLSLAGKAASDYMVVRKNEDNYNSILKAKQNIIGTSDSYYVVEIQNISRIKKEYNNKGQVVKLLYMGDNNQLIESESGYSIIQYFYNKNGNVIAEKYYDKNNQPVNNKRGYFSIEYKYDENGQRSIIAKYDTDGKKI